MAVYCIHQILQGSPADPVVNPVGQVQAHAMGWEASRSSVTVSNRWVSSFRSWRCLEPAVRFVSQGPRPNPPDANG